MDRRVDFLVYDQAIEFIASMSVSKAMAIRFIEHLKSFMTILCPDLGAQTSIKRSITYVHHNARDVN